MEQGVKSVLVTGSNGFIGKNLMQRLRARGKYNVLECDTQTTPQQLQAFCGQCDFVFHFAGVNRPKNDAEFKAGNTDFTARLTEFLENANNDCPVLMSSSIQAERDNPYGRSKKMGEAALRAHAQKTGCVTFIYRLPNVFGKWSRPNYNSAVATFCYNISRGLPITVNDPAAVVTLVYIDDVIDEFLSVLDGAPQREIVSYPVTLKALTETLYSFQSSRETLLLPNQSDALTAKLYATYLSFMPPEGLSYGLKTHADARGSFTEVLKTEGYGQISVNVGHEGVVKGNHYHNSKNEKFMVVSGRAVIKFRRVGDTEIYCYDCDGKVPQVVDIPCGYTHSITAVGGDSVTLMWANEPFDPAKSDTYYEEVEPCKK